MEKTAEKQDQVVFDDYCLLRRSTQACLMYLFFSSCPSATHKGSSQFTSYISQPANPLTFLLHMWYPSPFIRFVISIFKDLLILVWFFRNWNFQKAEHALDVSRVTFLRWDRVATYFLDRRDHKLLKQIFLAFCFCFLPSQKLSPLPMLLTWNQIKWNLYKK